MVSLTIRDVPDEVRDELATRAARHGQSMQEYVRAALGRLVAVPDQADVLDRVRRRARTLPAAHVDAVLGDLDADRR
jgi:plasmid stability protein